MFVAVCEIKEWVCVLNELQISQLDFSLKAVCSSFYAVATNTPKQLILPTLDTRKDKMIRKVFICGAQSVGKSTLCAFLEKYLRIENAKLFHYREVARGLAEEQNLTAVSRGL